MIRFILYQFISILFGQLGHFKIGANLDLVAENNFDKLEARYGNLLPVIVKAIQEESAEKDKEIKALKERLNALEKRLNQILYKKEISLFQNISKAKNSSILKEVG